MDPWVMVVIGIGVFGLPFLLMRLFNRAEVLDARGRRRSARWRAKPRRVKI